MVKYAHCVIMHDDLLNGLAAAGLDTGLNATRVLSKRADEFHWVRGAQPLGHALCPFGPPPCTDCGWARPRYGFYPTYDIGDMTGWMWSAWSGPVDPIVSSDVFRFLRDHPSMRGKKLKGFVRGDISEIDQAFLPAKYRRPEHAVPWATETP